MAEKINVGKFINNLDSEDLSSEKLQGVVGNVYAKAIKDHKTTAKKAEDNLKDKDKETVEFTKSNHDRLKAHKNKPEKDLNKDDAPVEDKVVKDINESVEDEIAEKQKQMHKIAKRLDDMTAKNPDAEHTLKFRRLEADMESLAFEIEELKSKSVEESKKQRSLFRKVNESHDCKRNYKNVRFASQEIEKKGYSHAEANDIALKLFDNIEGDTQRSLEWHLEKILPKEEFDKEYPKNEGVSSNAEPKKVKESKKTVGNKKLTEAKTFQPMTLREYGKKFLDGYLDTDVYDTEIDMGVAFVFDCDEEPTDNYEKFLSILADNVMVKDAFNDGALTCDFSGFYKPYNDKINDWYKKNGGHQEFEGEEGYYDLVLATEGLVSGSYSEEDYKELCDIFTSKKNLVGESLIKESAEKIQPGNIYSVLVKELPAEDIDHHYSDLYVRKTPKSTEIVNRLTTKSLLSTFKDNIDGDIWYELPFCYVPYFGESKELTEKNGFLKNYKGCKIIETPSSFVATNEYGLTIGESKTVSGAEGIIDDYVNKKESKKVESKNLKEGAKPSELWYNKKEVLNNIWGLVCEGDDRLEDIRYIFESGLLKPNEFRYDGWGAKHSLIMGALRNGNYKAAELLKSLGEKILKSEVEEYKDLMARKVYSDETTRDALDETKSSKKLIKSKELTEGKKIDLYVNGEYVCSSTRYKRVKDFVDAVKKDGKVTYAGLDNNGKLSDKVTKTIKDTDKVVGRIVTESKKLREADGENMTIETSTSILDMFYPTLYETTNDFYIDDNKKLDDILADVSMKYAEEAIGEVFPNATLKFVELTHPRQYNYGGENVIFTVTLPKTEYEAKKSEVMNDPAFEEFLKKNSPRSGYIPFGAYTLDKFDKQDPMYSIGQMVKFANNDEDMQYRFDDDFRDELYNNFETYDDLWEETMEWLQEHDQTYEDFKNHFNVNDDQVVDLDSIFGWISEHDTLAQDFENRFGISLGESLKEAINPKFQAFYDKVNSDRQLAKQVDYLYSKVLKTLHYDMDEIRKEVKNRALEDKVAEILEHASLISDQPNSKVAKELNALLDESLKEDLSKIQEEQTMKLIRLLGKGLITKEEFEQKLYGIIDEGSKLVRAPMFKNIKIKDFYTDNYPEDDLGEEINDTVTVDDVVDTLNNGGDLYKLIGVTDSLVRERLFEFIADICNTKYDRVYKKWLEESVKTKNNIHKQLMEESEGGAALSGFKSEELDDIFKVGAKFTLKKPMELEVFIPDDWRYDWSEDGFTDEELEEIGRDFRQELEDLEQFDDSILDKYIVLDKLEGAKLELPAGFELTVAENIPNTQWFNGNPWFTEVVFDTKDGQIRQFYNSIPGPTFIAHNS